MKPPGGVYPSLEAFLILPFLYQKVANPTHQRSRHREGWSCCLEEGGAGRKGRKNQFGSSKDVRAKRLLSQLPVIQI